MRDIKFRAWDGQKMHENIDIINGFGVVDGYQFFSAGNTIKKTDSVMQYVGVEDRSNFELFIDDICEFDNGDRFVIRCEEHLEAYVHWITKEPECEDQARDFYRISNSTRIGNSWANPELLEDKHHE